MITFQNTGVIDLLAVTTFGINAKSNKSPIGYFGTGLKYAIAIILRMGGTVRLYRCLEEHVFTLLPATVKDKEFQVVCMDGAPLGFTTRLGINWEAWMAFRELECNTRDEQGATYDHQVDPVEGYTTIQVEGVQAFEDAYHQRSQFILDSQPLYEGAELNIHPGASNFIYYRGILVGKMKNPSAYTYNLQAQQELTEDRTLKHEWAANWAIAGALVQCLDADIVADVATRPDKGTFESQLSFADCGRTPSETFMRVVADLRRGPKSGAVLPGVRSLHEKHAPPTFDANTIKLTATEQADVDWALEVLSNCGCHNIRNMEIEAVAFLGHGTLGRAHNGKCYLSKRVFVAGRTAVVGTLFEEYCHLEMSFQDEDRDFQNYLIDTIARQAIAMHGHNVAL